MIDKLDVRISEFALPGPVLKEPIEELKRHPHTLFRPSRYYQYVCDPREHFSVDAVVHLYLRMGRPTHKVEIIDAGEKTLTEMVEIICHLFEVDPWSLEVMRVDLAADVENFPVPWFKHHAYISRKQFSSRIAKSFELELQFVDIGGAIAQTIYAGKRPNLIRIYDKLGEWRMQLRAVERDYERFNREMASMEMTEEQRYFGRRIAPTFESFCEWHGYSYKPGVDLTRVERQIGGRIPPEFSTIGHLRHAHEARPFCGLKIIPSSDDEGFRFPPEGVSIRNYLAALGFERLREQMGNAQQARQHVYKHANGNGKRVLDSLAECIRTQNGALNLEEIQHSYRTSTIRQTSQVDQTAIHLSPTYA